MAQTILTLEAVSRQYTERPLFADATLTIASGERVGVVGVNGSGKTSLLRIAAGIEPPDSGRVVSARGLRIAYLPQNPALTPDLTVLAQLFSGDSPALQLVRAYTAAADALAHAPDDAALQRQLAELGGRMDASDAWSIEQRARAILSRLGVSDLTARTGDLSGGMRRRVAMAAALIDEVDLLILDEPTNHIDTATIAWLEEFLGRAPSALLLVSHDRYLLERVCVRIVELDGGRLYSYDGSYARFLELRAERLAQQTADEGRRQTILRKELVWLRRGAQARTTKQQARIDRIGALQEILPPEQRATLTLDSLARRLGKKVFDLTGVSKQYGQRTLLDGLTLSIGPGERVGIIGPNGSGKTTLLNIMSGKIAPDSGSAIIGETVHLAYYDQETAGMDPAMRAIDYVRSGAELIQLSDGGQQTAAQMLERFLFTPSAHYSAIGTLSGGERRRLYLLRALIDAPNVLLLDEPTNDLDIQTLAVLEDYLDSFAGTVVVVTHDRYFLDRTIDRTLAFVDGKVVEYPGGYSAYAADIARRATETARERPKPAAASPKADLPRRLTFAETRELRELEAKMAALEAEQARLNALLAAGGDYQATARHGAALTALTATLETTFARWAALAEIAEAGR